MSHALNDSDSMLQRGIVTAPCLVLLPRVNSIKRHGVLWFKCKVYLSRTHRVKQGNSLDKTSFTSAARLSVLQNAPKISSNKAKLSWLMHTKGKGAGFGKPPGSVFCTEILLPIEITYLSCEISKRISRSRLSLNTFTEGPGCPACWGQVLRIIRAENKTCTVAFRLITHSEHDWALAQPVCATPSVETLSLKPPQQTLASPHLRTSHGHSESGWCLSQTDRDTHPTPGPSDSAPRKWTNRSQLCWGLLPSTAFPCAFSPPNTPTPSTWCSFNKNSFKRNYTWPWRGFGQQQKPFSQQYPETQVQEPRTNQLQPRYY